jgi:hypothetical protein
VNDPGRHTFGDHSNAENSAAVIIEFDDIAVEDIPFGGIRLIYSDGPPGIVILDNAMTGNLIQPVGVLIIMGMESESRMRADDLKGVFLN